MKKIIVPFIFVSFLIILGACGNGTGTLGGSIEGVAHKLSHVSGNLSPASLGTVDNKFVGDLEKTSPDFYQPQPDLVRLYLETVKGFMEIATAAFAEMSTHLDEIPMGTGTVSETITGDYAGTYDISYTRTDTNNFSFLIYQPKSGKLLDTPSIAVKSVNGNQLTIYVDANFGIRKDDKQRISTFVKAEVTYNSETDWTAKLSLSNPYCDLLPNVQRFGSNEADGHQPRNLVFYLSYNGTTWKGFGEEYSLRFADPVVTCEDWDAATDSTAGVMISRFVATSAKVKAEVAVMLRTKTSAITETDMVTYALNKADHTYNLPFEGVEENYNNPFCIDTPREAYNLIGWGNACGISDAFSDVSLLTSVPDMLSMDITMPTSIPF